jgi:hypothetical protein
MKSYREGDVKEDRDPRTKSRQPCHVDLVGFTHHPELCLILSASVMQTKLILPDGGAGECNFFLIFTSLLSDEAFRRKLKF